jgi:hypothetical protein
MRDWKTGAELGLNYGTLRDLTGSYLRVDTEKSRYFVRIAGSSKPVAPYLSGLKILWSESSVRVGDALRGLRRRLFSARSSFAST